MPDTKNNLFIKAIHYHQASFSKNRPRYRKLDLKPMP